MSTCPKCRKSYSGTHTLCPEDGEVLVPDAPGGGSVDLDLRRGETVGQYVIEGKLGRGTFGDVYRAIQPLIGKQVAIKILSHKYSGDPMIVSRFIAEARAVNQIRHRNIIDIFSFGQLPDGRHYHIMELLAGTALDEHLRAQGRLSPVEAILVLRPIARALDAAHAAGIAHRDLKPANVFLARDEDGKPFPKLLDFGIAKLMTDEVPRQHQTATGMAVGTPDYMSPEQCQGADVDHRTDVYAFGIMAYQLMTGVLPFVGQNVVDVLVKQMTVQAVPPSKVCPDLPASIDAPIAWMMEKTKEKRPFDLATAMRALEEAIVASGLVVPRTQSSQDPAASSRPEPAAPQPGSLRTLADPALSQTLPIDHRGPLAPESAGRHSAAAWALAAIGAFAIASGLVFMARRSEAPATIMAIAPEKSEPPKAEPEKADPPPVEAAKEVDPPLIKLTISATPKDMQVIGPGGVTLAHGSGTIELPRGQERIHLEFKAPGYQPQSKDIVPAADESISVSLKRRASERKRPAVKKKKAGIDDIESFD
jgi:eukaryotic-like serine/threonine-protein kinase